MLKFWSLVRPFADDFHLWRCHLGNEENVVLSSRRTYLCSVNKHSDYRHIAHCNWYDYMRCISLSYDLGLELRNGVDSQKMPKDEISIMKYKKKKKKKHRGDTMTSFWTILPSVEICLVLNFRKGVLNCLVITFWKHISCVQSSHQAFRHGSKIMQYSATGFCPHEPICIYIG